MTTAEILKKKLRTPPRLPDRINDALPLFEALGETLARELRNTLGIPAEHSTTELCRYRANEASWVVAKASTEIRKNGLMIPLAVTGNAALARTLAQAALGDTITTRGDSEALSALEKNLAAPFARKAQSIVFKSLFSISPESSRAEGETPPAWEALAAHPAITIKWLFTLSSELAEEAADPQRVALSAIAIEDHLLAAIANQRSTSTQRDAETARRLMDTLTQTSLMAEARFPAIRRTLGDVRRWTLGDEIALDGSTVQNLEIFLKPAITAKPLCNAELCILPSGKGVTLTTDLAQALFAGLNADTPQKP